MTRSEQTKHENGGVLGSWGPAIWSWFPKWRTGTSHSRSGPRSSLTACTSSSSSKTARVWGCRAPAPCVACTYPPAYHTVHNTTHNLLCCFEDRNENENASEIRHEGRCVQEKWNYCYPTFLSDILFNIKMLSIHIFKRIGSVDMLTIPF